MNMRSLWLCAAVMACNSSSPSAAATSQTDGSGSASTALRIVSADTLDRFGGTIVDVRERADFEAGHLEGARWVDAASLRATVDGVDGQVAPPEQVQAAFAAAALPSEGELVVLGADNGVSPARVMWTLRYSGHRGTVGLLDGGMARVVQLGLPLQTGPSAGGGMYRPGATRSELRVDKAWMLAHLDDANVIIFDVRTREEFDSGHIPGATLVEWSSNVAETGLMRSQEQIRALHQQPNSKTLVVYCRTGSRAAMSWAALRVAGYSDVRLYDGSWAEWGSDPDTPKS